jgi:hypothetical protein
MEQPQSFISQLREIRGTLKEALLNAENFEYKLIGPSPSQIGEKSNPKPIDCVSQVLGDISRLSQALVKATTRPHEIFGDFAPKDCAEAVGRSA